MSLSARGRKLDAQQVDAQHRRKDGLRDLFDGFVVRCNHGMISFNHLSR